MGHSYRDLRVWQAGIELVADVYKATQSFPKAELYGLVQQVRRAAVSVVSNIAEGQGRNSPNEFAHFLGIARGSLLEAETQLFVAAKLGYLPQNDLERLLKQSGSMNGMVNRLMDSLAEQQAKRAAGSA